MANGLKTLLSMRMRVWPLASLSGLRILHRWKLWCRSQMWLGSHVAPMRPQSLQLPYAADAALKRRRKKKVGTKKMLSKWTLNVIKEIQVKTTIKYQCKTIKFIWNLKVWDTEACLLERIIGIHTFVVCV